MRAAQISKAPNNSDFQLGLERIILVTDREIPFMLSHKLFGKGFRLKVNGSGWTMELGDIRPIPETGCRIWLYDVKEETGFFRLTCT